MAAPQLGSCASPGRAWRLWVARHSQEEAGPLGAQPLQLAAFKAADALAVDHSGVRKSVAPDGQLQKSSAPDSAEPERLNIKNSVQTTMNGDSLDYDCGRGHKVARVCCHPYTCAAMLPLGSYPILRRLLSGAAILSSLHCHPLSRRTRDGPPALPATNVCGSVVRLSRPPPAPRPRCSALRLRPTRPGTASARTRTTGTSSQAMLCRYARTIATRR